MQPYPTYWGELIIAGQATEGHSDDGGTQVGAYHT
jgi:hypothetical protein